MLPGIGGMELLIIFVILLVLFGSNRMRALAKSIGKGLGEVRRIRQEIEEGVGMSALRQAKEEVVQEVKKAAGSVTEVVVDLRESGEGRAKGGGKGEV